MQDYPTAKATLGLPAAENGPGTQIGQYSLVILPCSPTQSFLPISTSAVKCSLLFPNIQLQHLSLTLGTLLTLLFHRENENH